MRTPGSEPNEIMGKVKTRLIREVPVARRATIGLLIVASGDHILIRRVC